MMPDWIVAVAFALAVVPCALFLLNLRLYRPPPATSGRAACDRISVLIPARNEAKNIHATLSAVCASRGVDFEVLVLDDHSTDNTSAIVEGFARRDPRVRLLTAPPLPGGWCGKQHACHVLAESARHPLLVFLDADVRLSPDALPRMIEFMREHPVSLASGIPRQEMGTVSEHLLIPLIHFILLGFLPMDLMRRMRWPAMSAGCGQLFVAQLEAYRKAGGHAALRDSLHDGLKLPRVFRRAGFLTGLFDATDIASCRMYQSDRETWSGLLKNAAEGLAAPGLIGPMTVILLGGQVLPFVLLCAAPFLSVNVWILAAVACAMVPRLVAARQFRQPLLATLLHPVGVLALVAIQWIAFVGRLTRRPLRWKDRAYSPLGSRRAISLLAGFLLLFITVCGQRTMAAVPGLEGEQAPGSPTIDLPSSEASGEMVPTIALADQFGVTHSVSFPRTNVLVLTLADRRGSEEVDGWLTLLKGKLPSNTTMVGIADLRGLPGFLRGRMRQRLRRLHSHPVLVDWEGEISDAIDAQRNTANVLLVGRDGRILWRGAGPAGPASVDALVQALRKYEAAGR